MQRVLSNLKPEKVFYYFEEICRIPHGSNNTKAISDYCVKFAKEHALPYYQDEQNNVMIKKKASKGYQEAPPLILQGHLDMVCEKREGMDHDFDKDSLPIKTEGDRVFSDGTTLGGDDGIAIAYFLAILDDDTIAHPDLEIVMTTEEEIGMEGAEAFDTSLLLGKHLINVDSEEEGKLLVSCAGGATFYATLPLTYEEKEGCSYTISVKGLCGGHSGADIDKQRANANLLLGRIAAFLKREQIPCFIKKIEGGQKDNAIPREGCLSLLVDTAVNLAEEKLCQSFQKIESILKEEYKETDPQMTLCLSREKAEKTAVYTKQCDENILTLLLNGPNGIQTMSKQTEGIVESSSNLGIIKIEKEKIIFVFALRSSKESLLHLFIEKLEFLTHSLGGTSKITGRYPAWEYKKDSLLRKMAVEKYKELTQNTMEVLSIHAGLECGIFSKKIQNLDAISIGPDIYSIHTPEESLSISSVARMYEYLLVLLREFGTYFSS